MVLLFLVVLLDIMIVLVRLVLLVIVLVLVLMAFMVFVVLVALCCRTRLGSSRTTFKNGAKTLHTKFYCVSINADLQFLFFTSVKSSLNNSCLESVFQ